ncbi:MAG: iron-containing alcohol dehydrogenase [Clostridiales Family XIII bacterium]|nr:iron-containing alcohol dehydrogenase [Clostridia bacterium]MDY3012293.1 iron-containing alcohol dehydrogenase [Clostridiales Family XIII bacterium]
MIINHTFAFNHRTRICFGPGICSETGKEVGSYGTRALIVTDRGVRNAGIVDKIQISLRQAGVEYAVYDKILPNPRDTSCDEAAELGKDFGADVILGIGGGSSMDSAKAVSVLMSNGGSCSHWAKVRKFDKELFPVICVPTTCGTGSEVTFEAVITATELGMKVSISDGFKMAPKVAIMDPELTMTVPPLVTASTGMDALTHALEAFTCTYSHPISDGIAMYAMNKIAGSIVTATKEGSNLKAREDMMVGSLMAGIAFTNTFLGAVHCFSERLGGFYDIPHGIANSIFLPFVTEYNMRADYEKHAIAAKCLGIETFGLSDEEAAAEGVSRLFDLNDVLGIPKFSELEVVDPKDFEEIAALCDSHACKKANPRPIGHKQFLEILQKAYDF